MRAVLLLALVACEGGPSDPHDLVECPQGDRRYTNGAKCESTCALAAAGEPRLNECTFDGPDGRRYDCPWYLVIKTDGIEGCCVTPLDRDEYRFYACEPTP